MLNQDLAALEQAPTGGVTSPLPLVLKTLDDWLGALYVVEGSSLGGQILYRLAHAKLGVDQHSGASFFFGDGPETGSHWKDVLKALEEHMQQPGRAAEAAAMTFSRFYEALAVSHG